MMSTLILRLDTTVFRKMSLSFAVIGPSVMCLHGGSKGP